MNGFRDILLGAGLALAVIAMCAVSWILGRENGRTRPNFDVNVRTDTLVVRDTIREKYPVFVEKWKTRTELVQVRDTVRRTDTLFMALDFESRTYQGEDYRAVVTGYRPELAEIAVFPKTVYLQTEIQTQPAKKRARLGFGATAGPAVIWTPGNGVQAGAGVAAGLTLNF